MTNVTIGLHKYDEQELQSRILAILEGDCDDPDLWDDLYAHYLDEMPYGTAKGRDGDPDEWLFEKLSEVYAPQ